MAVQLATARTTISPTAPVGDPYDFSDPVLIVHGRLRSGWLHDDDPTAIRSRILTIEV